MEHGPRSTRRTTAPTIGARERARRPLRIFPFDPMVDRFRDPVVSEVPFEHVTFGPAGRLIEIVDFDAAAQRWYPPLNLDAPDVLIGQGLTPSESDFRFHQQMTYAVAMRVLEVFERGLGRPLTWLTRLRLLPHAFVGQNAYFDPNEFAVMFGYFEADRRDPGSNLGGQSIFTCLSYDVVAHQVCHPVMWHLRPSDRDHLWSGFSVKEPDAAAFQESMADLVAILVRFSEPDVVAGTIREHGADLVGTPLLRIAMQFGTAMNVGPALRTFPDDADRGRYETETEAHARGMLLTSAFVEAFLGAHREQTSALLRLNGGPPAPGNVHPDLAHRLADEAAGLASKVARSAIAAIDYLPPFELRFYDVLRAVLTTDTLLFGRANHRFRSLLIESFHRRGLIPSTAGSLATSSLLLDPIDASAPPPLPHASEALLHTVTAVECRRQFMVQPSRVKRVTKELRDQHAQQVSVWAPEIEAYAHEHASRLMLDRHRPVTLAALAASNQMDSAGNLVARVIATLVQPGDDDHEPRGVTLVCDSVGDVQFIIGRARRLRRPTDGHPPTPEQRQLARSLTRAIRPGQ